MKHFDLDGSFTVQLLAQLQPQGIDGHVSQTIINKHTYYYTKIKKNLKCTQKSLYRFDGPTVVVEELEVIDKFLIYQ